MNPFRSNRSITGRLALPLTLIAFAALLCGLLAFLSGMALKHQCKEHLREHLRDSVALGALQVDAELHNTLMHSSDENSEPYRIIQTALQDIKRSLNDIHYVYTMRTGPGGEILFVVDATTNTTEIAHLGEEYSDASSFLKTHFAALDEPIVEEETYTDRWGTWLSGYAPFYTSDGKRAGVLGMDVKADTVKAVGLRAYMAAALLLLGILPLCIGLGILLARYLQAPFQQLRAQADTLIRWQSVPVENSHKKKLAGIVTVEAVIKMLAHVLDGIHESIVATDTEGYIIYLNATACTLLGNSREALLGRHITVFGDSKNGATQEQVLRATLDNGSWQGEITNDDVNGREIIFECKTQILQDENDTPLGIVGISRNITTKREDERKRREVESHLRNLQKLESVGTFAGGIAHEINNPIMGIMGFAQLILDKSEPDDSRTMCAQEIIGETERIATLIKNLLSFAREDHQSIADVCFSDMIEQVLSLMRTVLRHDHIALDIDVPKALPLIQCRAQQIQQVIMNLITNARDTLNEKYPGEDDKKRITIVGKSVKRDGASWLCLTVEDSGMGIPDDIRRLIFDPFFSTRPRSQYAGLGLSISYGIIQDHGGRILVDSKPGEGTRVTIELPVDRDALEDDQPENK